MTTLRPLGPSVTFTVLARMSTPRSILSRASVENLTSLAAIFVLLEFRSDAMGLCGLPFGRGALALGALEHSHDVGLLHDEELLAIDLDLGAGPFAEQDAVAGLQLDRNELAGFVA